MPRQVAIETPLSPAPVKSLEHRVSEAFESLTDVIGYASWFFIVFWFSMGRRELPKRPGRSLVALLLLMELSILAAVVLGKRYVTIITGPVQVWAALGAVALNERLRRRAANPEVAEIRSRRLLAGLAVLLAVSAGVSLLSRNHGNRHVERRELGRLARERFGPNRTILAQSPQLPYYADARIVFASQWRYRSETDLAALRVQCRRYGIDLIELHVRAQCSPWFLEQILSAIGDRDKT